MNKKILLFDIDYTLFDVGKYRTEVFSKLKTYFPDVPNFMDIAMKSYDEMRQSGWFEVDRFTTQLLSHLSTTVERTVLEEVWAQKDIFTSCLYPETEEILVSLEKKNITLGIFSSGHEAFQKMKIETLAHFFENEHIHIHGLKDEKIPEIFKKYKEYEIILVDDYIPVIENAKKIKKDITAIWIKRGRLSERFSPSSQLPPDFIIETLRSLPEIVDSI